MCSKVFFVRKISRAVPVRFVRFGFFFVGTDKVANIVGIRWGIVFLADKVVYPMITCLLLYRNPTLVAHLNH